MTPNRLWIGIFAIWAVFLSGILNNVVGSPGVLQALRLNSFLNSRKVQLTRLQETVQNLQTDAEQLEKSKTAQQREIRRVLGYASPDEIIFDFSTGDSI